VDSSEHYLDCLAPDNYFQPATQPFPTPNGVIPATHGQAVSFFRNDGVRGMLGLHSFYLRFCSFLHQVQQVIAFVPDDCSATYLLNVETNTTQTVAGPSTKDTAATYFAGLTSLVQLDSHGAVSYLPFDQADANTNAAAKWSKVVALANAAPPSTSASTSTSASGSAAKPSGTSKSNSSSSTGSTSSKGSNDAAAVAPRGLVRGLVSAAILACAAVLF
jgi:hypothetical protein